jgi:hypothetical protein
MLGLVRIALVLIQDALRWAVLLFRSPEAIQAENVFLRRQLALCLERGVRPRRIDAATRISLTLLSRHFDWRAALVVVTPESLLLGGKLRRLQAGVGPELVGGGPEPVLDCDEIRGHALSFGRSLHLLPLCALVGLCADPVRRRAGAQRERTHWNTRAWTAFDKWRCLPLLPVESVPERLRQAPGLVARCRSGHSRISGDLIRSPGAHATPKPADDHYAGPSYRGDIDVADRRDGCGAGGQCRGPENAGIASGSCLAPPSILGNQSTRRFSCQDSERRNRGDTRTLDIRLP